MRAAPKPFWAAALLALPVTLSAQTVDQVVDRYYRAVGGLDKMKAVQAMRITGRMSLGQGMEATFMRITKRPNLARMEFTVQGMTAIQAYDGSTAWGLMPFMGQTTPQALPADLARGIAEAADFDNPLVDSQSRGIQVELVGNEQVEGASAFKLKVTVKSGDVTYYFLDAETYLPLRTEAKRVLEGRELSIVTTVGDYRDEGGLMIAHAMEISGQGPGTQSFVIDKVELNPALKDQDFKMPDQR